jgi:fructose-1,6-bisphosphatase/inositol monophosphatase family enzyme
MYESAAPHVRVGTIEDRPNVAEFLMTSGHRRVPHEWTNADAPLAALLAEPDARLLLAERDGIVVGAAALCARHARVFEARKGWLEVLGVAADARGAGAVSALVAAADREAVALGCGTLVFDASLTDASSLDFYRAHDFTKAGTAQRFERAIAVLDGTLAEKFLAVAARAVTSVAHAIAGLADASSIGTGADGAPTEAADDAAEQAAVAELLTLGLPIVSEEKGLIGVLSLDPQQPWISLDPLDGSRNFVAGYPVFALSVGLVRDGEPIAGLVADLACGHRWAASTGKGATLNGKPIRTRRGPLGAILSPASGAMQLGDLAGLTRLRISGSTASDLAHVADGSLAAFVALERRVVHVHDLAAAMIVIEEAGGCVIDRNGARPILVPDPAACIEVVGACDRDLARALTGLA